MVNSEWKLTAKLNFNILLQWREFGKQESAPEKMGSNLTP